MVKKLLLLLALAIPSFGASSIGVSHFSGLDTQDNPASLQPGQSQDLLNIRLQPGGGSVYKRDGEALFQTLNAISTASVHGGYHFQQSGGSDVQLWGSDIGLYASVSDSAFVRVATGTVGATWQCTDNLGFAYCVTSAGDTPVKTDGTVGNTTYQTSIPAGTMITSTPLQLVVAGVSGSPSSIYFSANNNFTNFTVGPLPTDPYIEIINSPGSRLTQLGFYFGNLYWWKDQSLGYVSGSASQSSVGITIISNQIGTLDNSSAFWNPTTYDQGNKFNSGTQTTSTGNPYFNEMSSLGGIFFRGQDNHFYQYDGYTLTRLSRIITPNVSASSRRKSNSWTNSSVTDWNAGTIVNLDTTTNQPIIFLNTQYSLEPFTNLSSWTIISQNWAVAGGTVTASTTTAGSAFMKMAQTSSLNLPSGFDLKVNVALGSSANYLTVGVVDASTQGYVVQLFGGANFNYTAGPSTIISAPNQGFQPDPKFGVTLGPGDTNYHTIEMSRTLSGNTSCYFDGVFVASYTQAGAFLTQRVTLGLSTSNGASPNSFAKFNTLQTGNLVSTGTFKSAIHTIGSAITTWGNFSVNQVLNGGTIGYSICSSTNSNMSVPVSCANQPINTQVAVSTGTYVQWLSTFTVTSFTQSPSLTNASVNWYEGTASDKAYIGYFQDAIWFSVSSGSTTSSNNTIFYLDLLNNTWLKDDIVANGFAVENNALYIGDTLSPAIYKYGGVTTDKSLPIHAYWKSMDFTGQDPTVQNSFEQADFAFSKASTTVNFVYTVDQSTTTTTSAVSLYSPNHSIVKRGFALPSGKIGTYFNFKIEDNSSLASWTLLGEKTSYTPLAWRPQTSL